MNTIYYEQELEKVRQKLAVFTGSLKYSEEGRALYEEYQVALKAWQDSGKELQFDGEKWSEVI